MLHGIVSVSYVVLDYFIRGAHADTVHQLHKFVLHVLNEVQTSIELIHHREYGQMNVRLLDAVIQHTNEHSGVVREVDHQLLLLLNDVKVLLLYLVAIMEKQIRLRAQLQLNRDGSTFGAKN